jgi:hypothetical protein
MTLWVRWSWCRLTFNRDRASSPSAGFQPRATDDERPGAVEPNGGPWIMSGGSMRKGLIPIAFWLTVANNAFAQTTSTDGAWTGSLSSGGSNKEMSLTVSGASGTIDIPTGNVVKSPLVGIGFEQSTGHVTFIVNNSSVSGALFTGTLVGNCMIGTWTQATLTQPLTLCRSGTTPPASLAVTDLSGLSVEQPAIERMLAQGIMTPASPGRFAPTGTVSRATFAGMLQHMFVLTAHTHIAFSDVPASDPSNAAIQAAAPFMNRQVFCFGCQLTDKFLPDKAVSRGEAAVYMVRVLGAEGKVEQVAASDLPAITGGSADAASWGPLLTPLFAVALKHELITLQSDKALHPADPIERAHAAVLFDTAQSLASLPVRQ